jgi:response regulator RpfG family c-di-GMP phosphodiesterase
MFGDYSIMKNKKDFNIFLVDDDPFSQNMHHQHLMVLGYTNVNTFNNGESCLLELAQLPDIILLNNSINTAETIVLVKRIKRYLYSTSARQRT